MLTYGQKTTELIIDSLYTDIELNWIDTTSEMLYSRIEICLHYWLLFSYHCFKTLGLQ